MKPFFLKNRQKAKLLQATPSYQKSKTLAFFDNHGLFLTSESCALQKPSQVQFFVKNFLR